MSINYPKLKLACLKVLFVAILAYSFSSSANFAQSNWSGSSPIETADQNKLRTLEEKLFFCSFLEDSDQKRLERIEKEMFGEIFSGNISERIGKAYAALPSPQANPKAELTKPFLQKVKVDSLHPSPNTSNISRPSASPLPSSEEQEEISAKERMAALTAKDAEINNLQTEAVQLWRDRQPQAAIDKFEQVIRLDPQNAKANYSLGVAYEAIGAMTEALKCYQEAAKLDPTNHDYQEALKLIDHKLSMHKPAESSSPKQPPTLIEKSNEFNQLAEDAARAYQNKEYLSAIDLYKQLDERAPNQALTKYNIGSLYLLIGNPLSALDYYRAASHLNPTEIKYHEAEKRLQQKLAQVERENRQATAESKSNNLEQGATEKNTKKQTIKNKTKAPNDPFTLYGLFLKNSKEGPCLTQVETGSRTAQVGLQTGDIIKAVDNNVVSNVKELHELLLSKPPGARFQFTVQRSHKLGQILF